MLNDSFGIKLQGVLKEAAYALFGQVTKVDPQHVRVDEDFLRGLSDGMLSIDISSSVIERVIFVLRRHERSVVKASMVQKIVYQVLYNTIKDHTYPIEIDYEAKPHTILMCGVHGAGKTVTVGKMAYMLNKYGWKVTVGACDATRDAATEQLLLLTANSNVEVVHQTKNQTPVEISSEAYRVAQKNDSDLLLIDTAGRLPTKGNLMDELRQIFLNIKKINSSAPQDVVMIVDGMTGQSSYKQIDAFKKVVPITGLAVTKLDVSSKAGIIFSLVDKYKIPVHGVGIGHGIQDLQDFSGQEFAASIAGLF